MFRTYFNYGYHDADPSSKPLIASSRLFSKHVSYKHILYSWSDSIVSQALAKHQLIDLVILTKALL